MSNSVFEQRINGKKGKLVLFFIALAVLAMDVAVAIIAIASGIGFAHWIIPVVFATIDILLVPIIKYSNFRFKHSITFPIAYAVLTVALSSFAAFLIGFNVFTTTAMIFFFLSHVLLVVALVFAIRNASCVRKGGGGFAWISALLFGAIAVMHVSTTIAGGFYGQGPISKYRSVEFSLDEGTDTYVAEKVLPGIGSYANIPLEYKGKPVSAINGEILTDESVKYLELDCGSDVSIVPASGMEKSNTTLLINKGEVEVLRNKFASYAQFDDSYVALLNNVAPLDLEDEVYITFSYTKESLAIADYNLIPTWYGEVGEVFDLSLHAEGTSYADGYDPSDEEFLYRSYQNDAKIILPLMAEGVEINKTRIQTCFEKVAVDFGSVYAVEIGDSNDARYTIDSEFRSFNNSGYRYVIDGDPRNLLSGLESRQGFTLSWEYSVDGDTRNKFSSLADILSSDVTVYPVWKLNNPIITSAVADANAYIYGDNVTFTGAADAPTFDFQVRYEWYRDGAVISNSADFTVNNIFPDDSGVYTLKAIAYSSTLTTLESEVTKDVNIVVNKRPVSFNWIMPDNTTYSGTDKTISVSLKDADNDIINGDFVSGVLNTSVVRNAATYNLSLSINEEMQSLYRVADADVHRELVIAPYDIAVSWSNYNLTYNGESQIPVAEAYGVGEDSSNLVSITVNGASRNATVDITATAISNDTNYRISNSTQLYTINPRPVTLIWPSLTTFEYNGLEQSPVVESISGAVTGEETTLLNTINYLNRQKNAGSGYNVTASLTDSNYTISSGESCSFTINQKEVTFNWDDSTVNLVYNGTAQRATTSVVGVVAGDDVGLTYSDYSGAIHVGPYNLTVSITNANYKIASGAETTISYSITARPITLVWGTSTFTYNANNQIPSVTRITGAVTGEDAALLSGLVYSGEAMNVGSYEATATLASNATDYVIQNNATQAYTITQKLLTLTWSTATSFVYNREAQAPTADISGVIAADVVNLTLSDTSSNINVNSYSVTASIDNNNYKLPANVTRNYTITAKPITITWDSTTSFVYDGNAHTVTGTLNGVISPDSVAIVYSNTSANKGAGNYTVTASIENKNYSLTSGTSCQYIITPKIITIDWQSNRTFTYNAQAQYITATVPSSVIVSGDTVQLSYTGYSNNKNVGNNYTVTAASKNKNYTVDNATAEYSIVARTLSVNWENTSSYVYNGTAQYPKVTFGNTVAAESVNPTYTNYNNKNVGDYTVSVSINNSNYTLSGTLSKAYTITAKELTLSWTSTSFTYNGKAQAPTVKFGGVVSGDTVTATYSPTSSNINVGTYTVSVISISNSNYKLPSNASCQYKINEKTLTVSWPADKTLEYTGTAQAIEATLNGIISGDNVTKTYEYYKDGVKLSGKPKDAGTYTVKVIINNANYKIASGDTATFVIEAAPVTND